jgi:hypothetical protein
MLPGYVPAADIETAILALQFELGDVEELVSSAKGDGAAALQSRRSDIQQSLRILRDHQVGLREDPEGAATAAALLRLPQRQVGRATTRQAASTGLSIRPQAMNVDPARIPRPPTADIILHSPAPRNTDRARPAPSTPAAVQVESPTGPENPNLRP